jgi:Family of unknown function (DUF6263)
MELRGKYRTTLFLLVLATFPGCSGDDAKGTRVDDVEVIPALSGSNDPIDVQSVSARTQVHQPQLQLREGDRKYYRRIVEQRLHEQPGIVPERVWERLELMMSLTVREATADTAWVDVAFHEVRYQHEIGSQRVVYDSRSQADVPPEALVYSGLKENGFAIKLDSSNRVVDVQGFDQFLGQCYRSARRIDRQAALFDLGENPTDSRTQTMAALSFLDESIALLPVSKLQESGPESQIGSRWEQSSFRSLRVPTEEKLELGLIHVSGEVAHLKLSGTIHPLDQNGVLVQEGIRSRVIGGTLTGSCSIETRTGFPISSSIQRTIDLEVVSPGAPPVVMRKSVVSTLEDLKLTSK